MGQLELKSFLAGGGAFISWKWKMAEVKSSLFGSSLGRFSNIQKYLLSLSFQDVKYSSTQYIVPGSNLWGIPALCYDLNLGMIFYFNQDFSGSGVVSDATPHTHVLDHSLAWKILVSIKNHPLTLVHNRGQVYAIPCFTGKYTGWKCTITWTLWSPGAINLVTLPSLNNNVRTWTAGL